VLMRSATMVWSAVDAQAAVATEAYRATEMELRRRTDERLQALLDALLEGQEAPGLAARAAAGLDLPERGPYAVVVLRSERRERESYRRPVEGDGFRFIWRMRADCEVGVVALAEGQGLDGVARALDGRCSGPGGISPVVAGLAELGRARRLAELALRTCPPDATAVVRLDQRMPTALVVSQPELAGRLVSDVFGSLLELEPADRAVLLETLDVWLSCEGSAGRAAGRLYCHRNTVFNRLRRLGAADVPVVGAASGSDRDDVGVGCVSVELGLFSRPRRPYPSRPWGLRPQTPAIALTRSSSNAGRAECPETASARAAKSLAPPAFEEPGFGGWPPKRDGNR
jgi:hypothetical protein